MTMPHARLCVQGVARRAGCALALGEHDGAALTWVRRGEPWTGDKNDGQPIVVTASRLELVYTDKSVGWKILPALQRLLGEFEFLIQLDEPARIEQSNARLWRICSEQERLELVTAEL